MLKFVNFSEKEIIARHCGNSHLGISEINRLKFKVVRCTEDFSYHGKLIYQKGKEYKLWIVKYIESVKETEDWYTATPRIEEDKIPADSERLFYVVPLSVFQYADNVQQVAPFCDFEVPDEDGRLKTVRYQLFVDINDGMQKLIEPWSLEKAAVVEYLVKLLKGNPVDYTLCGRQISNQKETRIIWLVRKKVAKGKSSYYFFDVLQQELVDWDIYAPDAKMSPISSGQAMVHIGTNTVRADKYGFTYRLGKSLPNREKLQGTVNG